MSEIAKRLERESLENAARLSAREKILLALELSQLCFMLSEGVQKKTNAQFKRRSKKIGSLLGAAKKRKSLKGYALIGGFAVSARSKPRATRDVDFLIQAEKIFFHQELAHLLKKTNYTYKVFISDRQDPLNNLVRIYDKEKNEVADLISTHFNWQDEIIQNAEEIRVEPRLVIPVAKTEDLIVLKLKAGGLQDFADVQMLIQSGTNNKSLDVERMLILAKRAKVDRKLKNLL